MHQARRHDYTLEHARNNQKPSAPLPGVQRLYNLIAKKQLCHAHLFRCLVFWARTLCSSSAAVQQRRRRRRRTPLLLLLLLLRAAAAAALLLWWRLIVSPRYIGQTIEAFVITFFTNQNLGNHNY